MLKQLVQFEYKIEGFDGYFLCSNTAPIPAVKEMLCQFMKMVGQIEDNIKAQQQQTPEEDLPVQDHCVEEVQAIEA